MAKVPISALVVAHNEEADLPDCLASLGFADEIVVFLDRSTDRSKEIAERAGARVVEGRWPMEVERRRASVEACRHDWVLEVDADERVTPELAAEIAAALPGAKPGAFLVTYDNYIGARHVRYGWGAYNGIVMKWSLFHKGCKTWRQSGLHTRHPAIDISGEKGRLNAHIRHNVDADFSDLFARLNHYSEMSALDAVAAGSAGSGWSAFRRFFSRFFKSYVSRKGYREGIYGVALALFAGLYPVLTYLKARELLDGKK